MPRKVPHFVLDLDHVRGIVMGATSDIDDMIERLQALKAIALGYFKGNWPG